MKYYVEAFRKYAVFSGRATRSEYWFFVLFNGIVSTVLALIAAWPLKNSSHIPTRAITPAQIVVLVYDLVALLPSLAVLVRRLHDTGRSGWWVFAAFLAGALMTLSNAFPSYALLLAIPAFVLLIVLLVFTVQDSQNAGNRYGPNPKAMRTPN